ncbi:MAG: RNA polymerase sigma factor [bacterium]|nr:RNA polymerase sigma factor [bacterium]
MSVPHAPTTPPEPTQELILAAKQGDMDAWSQLDRRYRIALSLFLRGKIPSAARRRFDTEDVLQSTFLSAFSELDSYEYKGEGSFLAWMVQILRNRLKTRLRRATCEKRDTDRDRPLTEAANSAAVMMSASPSELFSSAENQARLMSTITELPDDEREAVTMHFFDKKTFAQIARELDLPVKTVRRRVTNAIETMVRKMR